ncbi:mannitol dehydrogenase [uncultured Mitsuokella sp.]|uniref:mannitol dehydrogenase family protein n=1 Tax=uncultured Mitsuokella sp. TaxID=453120 RepID=UPI00261222C5|nr:mannitol dehydrogenase [uncultured Mitsuokella sp.]
MKKALHFGAGKIGRGFIADLLHDSGYEIVFADVVEPLVELVNEHHCYSLFRIDHDYDEKVIDHVCAYSSVREPEKVMAAIGEAEVITTSVLATNLPKIAPILAKGLKQRLAEGKDKVIVMACENAMMGTDILKKAMCETSLITADELDAIGYYPNTAVDRVVFDGEHHGKKGIEIGDAYELAIEKGKLPDPDDVPIQGAEYVDNLNMYLQRKIYIINCGHALSGYFGQVRGYTIVQEALQDPVLVRDVKAAILESAAALEQIYGFAHEDLVSYMDTMFFKRMTTPGLHDTIARVCREPIRKLSPNDRIMGPANQCEMLGLPNDWLLKGAACALHFRNPEDRQAEEIRQFIADEGIEHAIVHYTGVKRDNPMYQKILTAYRELPVKE